MQVSVDPRVPGLGISAGSVMAWDRDLVDCVEIWQRAGLPAIGLSLHQLGDHSSDRLARALRSSGLAVSSLQGARPYDLARSASVAERHAILCRTLDLAAEIGAECVVAMTGPRGDLAWGDAMELVVEQTLAALPEVRARDLRLAIEPVQPLRQDLSFVNLAADAVEIVRRVGDPAFGYVFDTYHLWWQRHIEQVARDSAGDVACVQVSDQKAVTVEALDREIPGEGIAPLRAIVGALTDAGFAGWWELEVISRDGGGEIGEVLTTAREAVCALWTGDAA